MTQVLHDDQVRATQPTTPRENRAWRAALAALKTRGLHVSLTGMTESGSSRICEWISSSEIGISEAADVSVSIAGFLCAPDPEQQSSMKSSDWADDLAFDRDDIDTRPLPQLERLYLSFVQAYPDLMSPAPDPVPAEEESIDWDFVAAAPTPVRSGRIKVRLRNTGRAKAQQDRAPWN